MENDLVTIVARQLKDAQYNHANALQAVERVQIILNKKTVLLQRAGEQLFAIEEIHNNLPE